MISHRGNTGGFEIAQAHRSATLLEVVEAIEGPIKLNICLTSDHGCNRQKWCPAHGVWADAQRAMLAVLSSSNIADLARTAVEKRRMAELVLIDSQPWN
jgi:Rrf2 family protein